MNPLRFSPAAALAVTLAASLAAAEQVGDVTIQPVSSPVEGARHGYLDHRVALVNRSAQRSHEVLLRLPATSYSWGGTEQIEHIDRRVLLAPGARAEVSLPQPPLGVSGPSQVRAFVDGSDWADVALHSLNSSFPAGTAIPDSQCVLVSRALSAEELDGRFRPEAATNALASGLGAVRFMTETREVTFVRSEREAADWNANWLACTCYDGVVLTGDELAAMPAGVRGALWQYVRCGGSLAVLGACEVPEAWAGRRTAAPGKRGNARAYYVGFGTAMVIERPSVAALTPPEIDALRWAWRHTLSPWRDHMNVTESHQSLPVADSIRVPVRGLFVLMLGFAILVGPVNLVVLARFKRPLWLLWTLPAAAAVTCGVVFSYALLADGVRPLARSVSVTILDHASRETATLGVTGYYCPLTPRDGLRFGYETELTPLVDVGNYGQSGHSRTLDWSRDQHLRSGWVSARVPAYFQVRRPDLRRERVEVRADEGGRLTALNGLGLPIQRLWYADAQGAVYAAARIPAGQTVALLADGTTAAEKGPAVTAARQSDSLRNLYAQGNWAKAIADLTQSPSACLAPGTYLAIVDGNPFLEPGVAGAVRRRDLAIVVGLLSPAEAEETSHVAAH